MKSLPNCLCLVFLSLLLAGCKSMSEEDQWLWNDSTNPPPASLQAPAPAGK